MKATVVVSCYNQKKYISECLESILSQRVNFDYEILVSDDCSNDGTQNVLTEYADKFKSRIKLILRTVNVGPAVNYVNLHDIADGDIVFHIDGDDVMLPGKMQKQYDVFLNNPTVQFCLHQANYFSDDSAVYSPTGYLISKDEKLIFFNAEHLAKWGTISVHSSYAYRRESRKTRGLNREFMEWFFAMDSLLPNGEGVFINETLLNYRFNIRGQSYLSTQKGRKKAYGIYFKDIYFYFKTQKRLRSFLYANALVSYFAMIFNNKSIDFKLFLFLFYNLYYFRPKLIWESYLVRRQVAPFRKK